MEKISKHSKLVILVILTIAAFLRIWKISEVPVSLFSDELDVGYHAYSNIKTGRDYMGNPWPLYFHSYADFRAPVYIYTAVPTVAIFGITPLGVRLPAMVFGVLGVWAMYLLIYELLNYGLQRGSIKSINENILTINKLIALVSALLL